MGLFRKKVRPELNAETELRERRIDELERERERYKAELEELMRAYSKATGVHRVLSKRRLGRRANDYSVWSKPIK